MSLHTAAFDGTFDKTCLGSSPVLKYVFLSLEYSDFLSFCPDAEEDFLALPEVCPHFSIIFKFLQKLYANCEQAFSENEAGSVANRMYKRLRDRTDPFLTLQLLQKFKFLLQ